MGFLNFLKKQKPKKIEFEDLDLPPAPPPLEKYDTGMGMPLDEISQDLMPELPPYTEDTTKPSAESEQFELPDMAGIEETPSELEKPEIPPFAQYKPSETMQPMETLPAEPEKRMRRHLPKSAYLNLNDLKDVLLGIKKVRNDLNITQDALMIFENVRIKEDRNYEKLNSISHDLQKKLRYMDKNLLKGEKA